MPDKEECQPGSGQSITEFLRENLGTFETDEYQIQRLTLDNARLASAHASSTAEWVEMYRKLISQRATLQAIVKIADADKPADIDKATYDYSRLIAIRNMAASELEKNKLTRKGNA